MTRIAIHGIIKTTKGKRKKGKGKEMVKVYKVGFKADKLFFVAKSMEVAMAGLHKGDYKKGEYKLVDEETGKAKKFVMYV